MINDRKTRILPKYTGEANDTKYNNLGTFNSTVVVDVNGKPLPTAPEHVRQMADANTISIPFYKARLTAVPSLAYAPTYSGVEIFDSSRSPSRNRLKGWSPKKVDRPFNSCWHFKNRLVYLPFAHFTRAANGTLVAIYKCYARDLPLGGYQPNTSLGYAGFEMYDDASRRAWWSMKPRFEGEISMLNFLFELKDFKNIAKAITKLRNPQEIVDRLKSLKRSFSRAPSKLYGATKTTGEVLNTAQNLAQTTAVTAAELRLINEFAIKPLMSDWTSILGQAGEIVRDVQSDFKLRGLEPQVSHYSEEQILQNTLVPRSANAYFGSDGTFWKQKFTATHQYKYNYLMRDRSDAFMRYWGLNLTPEAIWNALPFSFLLDYFWAVGDALHFMNSDPNVSLLSKQYCESILQYYSSGYSCSGDQRAIMLVDGQLASKGTVITGYTSSLYQRRVCLPNKGMATPKFKLPSGKQGWNMAALATCFI